MSWQRVVAIIVVPFAGLCVLGLFLPAVGHRHHPRTECADNLNRIGIAAIAYLTSPLGPGGKKGFSPHVRGLDEDDRPEDVGVVFALLVKVGEVEDAEVFVCPGSADLAPSVGDPSTFSYSDSDVRTSAAFSYGWVREQMTDASSKASTPMAADRTAAPPVGTSPGNHEGGRNILRFDGSVDFAPSDLIDPAGEIVDDELVEAIARLNLARSE